MKKKIIKKSIIFLLISIAVLLLNVFLMNKFTICGKSISIITALIILAVCFTGFVMNDRFENDNLKLFVKRTAVCCLIAFGIETFIFNFNSFAKDNTDMKYDNLSITTNNAENAIFDSDKITLNGDCELYFELNSDNINALRMEFEKENDNEFKCYTAIKDGNFSREFIRTGEKATSSNYGKCDFSFSTYGTLQSVLVGFYGITSPVQIKSVIFSNKLPFSFSEIRFYTLFLILTTICAVFSFKFYAVIYDRKKPVHRWTILVLTVLCSMSMLCFVNKDASDIEYTNGMNISYSDPYVQMFDAFQHKRTYIAIEPSAELLAMENPYDTSARSADGVSCAWDRAYYNGKYYSYYGVAPVFTYYYPYYFIHGKLPSINSACVFFGILSVIFMFGTIMAFVRKFIEKPNFLMLIMCLVASVFASGIYFNVDFSDMYALPGITGTCYLMLCLWCGLEACIRKNEKKQPLLFALCGLAFAFCLAAKPTRALSCLVIAPVFLEYLFTKSIKPKAKVISVSSFMIPVIAGCGAIMAYNYARFDSPTEFGAVYQLTVSNVTASGLRISFIPDAILHYFIQPLRMSGSFPFVEISGLHLSNHQAYVYSDFAVGALSVPFILAGLSAFPFLLYHLRRKSKKYKFNPTEVRKISYLAMFLMTLFIAWFNYCVAGIILSYVCDILPLITLLSAFVLLDTQQQTISCKGISGKAVCAVSVISAVTVILSVLEILSFRGVALYKNMPDILYKLEDIICFWN